ncbi:MAG: ParB/RepB/Spo0J family partition protein [Thermodesulfobacteriota bacterium]
MTSATRFQEVPLAQIDQDPAATKMVAVDDLNRLKDSIQKVGLLNPPWLRLQRNGERWQVVTGARRLRVAAILGWQEITARLLPENTPDSYCLLVHLIDNFFSRGFNLWEQATLAARLLNYCDRETITTKYLPYLGLPPSPAILSRLLKAAILEPPWPQLASQGRLALTAAATLAEWDPNDRAAAWPFLESLRLSQSKQEEFLEQVAILALREGLTPAAVLAREEIQSALMESDRTSQERTAAVRRQLSRWLQPRLNAARETFETALRKLGWKRNSRIHLHPPAAFEGPDFRLEIKFQDAQELRNLLAEIGRLTQQEDFINLARS